jgi:hypothetical protein
MAGAVAEHRAVLIATARPWDDEMRERIRRHQQDRAERVPGMVTVEEPLQLAQALTRHSAANTLVVVDCLTLWLTNLLMPAPGLEIKPPAQFAYWEQAALLVRASHPPPARWCWSATRSAWASFPWAAKPAPLSMPGPAQPAGGRRLRACHLDGGRFAPDLESPAVNFVKRIAFLLPLLCLLPALPARALQLTDDRGVTVTLPRRRSASSACCLR